MRRAGAGWAFCIQMAYTVRLRKAHLRPTGCWEWQRCFDILSSVAGNHPGCSPLRQDVARRPGDYVDIKRSVRPGGYLDVKPIFFFVRFSSEISCLIASNTTLNCPSYLFSISSIFLLKSSCVESMRRSFMNVRMI